MNSFVDRYVVFDTETTGFDANADQIIEIGALKYENDILIDEFSVLINPSVSIPPVITSITGITDDMVHDKETIEEVLPKFLLFIENFPLICHNTPFDIGFINANLKKLNLPILSNTTLDTLFLARKYIPEVYNYKLETLKKYFHLNFNSHRSIEDCKTTNYVYQECKKRATINV